MFCKHRYIARSVRDLLKEPLRHASNLCGPFLCNRASCCVPEAPLKGPLHMILIFPCATLSETHHGNRAIKAERRQWQGGERAGAAPWGKSGRPGTRGFPDVRTCPGGNPGRPSLELFFWRTSTPDAGTPEKRVSNRGCVGAAKSFFIFSGTSRTA